MNRRARRRGSFARWSYRWQIKRELRKLDRDGAALHERYWRITGIYLRHLERRQDVAR